MDSEYLDPAWTSGESLDWFWQLISDWMTPPGGILGRSDWEEVSGVEPEHTGGIMYLTWAGNASGSTSWSPFLAGVFLFSIKALVVL